MKIFNKKSLAFACVISSAISLGGPIVAFAAGPVTVNLLSAGNYTILAKSGISTTGTTKIVGDIGVSPAAATFITGFGLSLTVANPYATAPQVTGKVYSPNYASPTPTNISTAVNDMQTAYTDAAGRTNPTATELGSGNIGGMTLAPGLYKWGTSVTIPSNLILAGGADDVWIFQIAQTLNVSSATKVLLSGDAQASNIFWVVGGQTTIGTTASFVGNILDQTAIVLNTGASLDGRALAQTAVTLDSNSVTASVPTLILNPTPVAVTPAPVFTTPTVVVSPQAPIVSAPAVSNVIASNNGPIPFGLISAPAASSFVAVPAAAATTGLQIKSITKNLVQSGAGNDITVLQQFLIAQNKGSAARALGKVGATSHFGVLTRAALAEFQKNVGIVPALGNFGAITRAYISLHY